jgi:DNA repair exonuclease SbcCD ATPase subunit
LESLKANNSDQVEEIEQVKFLHHGLTSELVEAKSRLSQVVQDCATAKSTITSLNQQLDQMEELRERADRVPGLAHDSEVKDGIITVLEQKLESLNTVNQRLQCHQVEDEKRGMEISELKARLQTAEEAAQQLLVMQGELHSHEEELRTLKDAREQAIPLERELCQTKNRMSELNIAIANSNDTQRQLEDLRTETCHRRRDCENIEKRRKASEEEEAARPPVLEKEISAQKAEISELRAKLAEAERISKALPEMQTQMDQFSETFSSLKRELEDAHQAGNEVQSTVTVNAKLHQTIAELRNQAADAKQAGVSMKSLSEEMQQKDVQITSLRTELARLGIESQRQIETGEPNTEDLLDGGLSQDTCRLAEASPTHQQDDSIHSHHSTVENEPAATPHEELEPRKKRKRADRGASSVQANTSPCEEIVLISKTLEKTDSEVGTAHKTFADDVVGDQGSIEQDVDETDLIPESQPRMNDPGKSLCTDSMRSQSVSKIISSSPLSDVGEIFDPADQDQPVSDYYAYRKHSDQMSGTAARDDIAAARRITAG